MRIGFILIDGYALMSTAAAVEPLRAANLLAGGMLYDMRFLAVGGSTARASAGALFETVPLTEAGTDFDLVFVVAGGNPFAVRAPTLDAYLRRLDARRVRLGGISGGAALLALATALALLRWPRWSWLAAMAGGASLVPTAAAGHAWTADDRLVAVVADVVHLGAVSLWVGGLVALLVGIERAEDRNSVARTLSAAALVAVVVVAISGTVSGFQQVSSWSALTETSYGRLLTAKVVGFGILVVLGWVNRTRLVPLVAKAPHLLRRSVAGEVAVAAGVLALTAALIGQAPARVTYSQPYTGTLSEDALSAQLTVDPARAGSNELRVSFFGPDGQSSVAVDAVEVTASVGNVPPRRLDVVPVTASHIAVPAAGLTTSGLWTFEVTAVQAGVPTTLAFEVQIR